jgi:Recombination endonuclease VII
LKICKHCNVEKHLSDFYPRNNGCKTCCNKRAVEWNKNNPSKVKETRRKNKLKQKYGITPEEYDKMFTEQNGVCYLCGSDHQRRPLNVDHCHSTGRIRKLLCDKCNMALGLVNDSKELLLKMIGYLS